MNAVRFKPAQIPVLHNVDARTHDSDDAVRAALISQLYRPVRWVDTIRQLAALQCRTIIETGPGKVLTGLNKRISRDTIALAIADTAAFERALNGGYE